MLLDPSPEGTVAEIAAKMTPDRVAAADAANLYANGHDLKDPVPSPTCGDCMARKAEKPTPERIVVDFPKTEIADEKTRP